MSLSRHDSADLSVALALDTPDTALYRVPTSLVKRGSYVNEDSVMGHTNWKAC